MVIVISTNQKHDLIGKSTVGKYSILIYFLLIIMLIQQ